jgi:hypothetical protein
MTYTEKLAMADAYLIKKAGMKWNDLNDIDSLHDCDSEEQIIAMCDARLLENGFPLEEDY